MASSKRPGGGAKSVASKPGGRSYGSKAAPAAAPKVRSVTTVSRSAPASTSPRVKMGGTGGAIARAVTKAPAPKAAPPRIAPTPKKGYSIPKQR